MASKLINTVPNSERKDLVHAYYIVSGLEEAIHQLVTEPNKNERYRLGKEILEVLFPHPHSDLLVRTPMK